MSNGNGNVTRKHSKDNNFTILDNNIFRNKELSLKAKGLLSMMLSFQDNWEFSISGLAELSTDGVASVRSGLEELEKKGYLQREQAERKNGQFSKTIYHIYESSTMCEKPTRINRHGKTDTDKPTREIAYNKELKNKGLNNKVLTNKELNNKYINSVFEHWNTLGLTKHRELTSPMITQISNRLKNYSVDEINKTLTNYVYIINSDNYYFDHIWTLDKFMVERNFSRFTDLELAMKTFRDFKKKEVHHKSTKEMPQPIYTQDDENSMSFEEKEALQKSIEKYLNE